MRPGLLTFALVLALTGPWVLSAQAPTPGNFAHSVYYECDPVLEAGLDDVLMASLAPIYQRHVDSGALVNWGWNAHVMGGAWRRQFFMVASDRTRLLQERAAIIAESQAEAPAAIQMLNSVCPTHEDYIWSVTQTSSVATPTTEALPTAVAYYYCNQSTEAQADEAMRDGVAPVLEDLVREGQLQGWAWLTHDSGGLIRRATVYVGSDPASILEAIDEMAARITAAGTASGLLESCSSHVDYHWSPVN